MEIQITVLSHEFHKPGAVPDEFLLSPYTGFLLKPKAILQQTQEMAILICTDTELKVTNNVTYDTMIDAMNDALLMGQENLRMANATIEHVFGEDASVDFNAVYMIAVRGNGFGGCSITVMRFDI